MKKLAIVGSHPATREQAPWKDDSFTIWIFNEAPQAAWVKRWDASFQIHQPDIYTSEFNLSNKQHWAWLQQKRGKPIYMIDADPRVPDSVRLPLEEMTAEMPEQIRRYFELSAAYSFVLALHLGYQEIHIWGMDLVSNTEYQYQANCWRSWIMYAWGKGVNVVLHCNEGLFGDRLYGYDGEVSLGSAFFQDRAKYLEAGWGAAEKNLNNMKKLVQKSIEAQDYSRTRENFMPLRDASIKCGEYAGMLGEARRFANAGDRPIYRTDFERTAAQAQRDGESKKEQMYHASGKVEYLFNTWKQLKGDARVTIQLRAFIGEMTQHAYDAGALLGAFHEGMQYMLELDQRIQAAGGAKSVELKMREAMAVQ